MSYSHSRVPSGRTVAHEDIFEREFWDLPSSNDYQITSLDKRIEYTDLFQS